MSGAKNGSTPSDDRPPGLVDIGWVAARLGVNERHVRRLVAEERIPFVRLVRLVRFDPEQIERWIDDRRRGPSL